MLAKCSHITKNALLSASVHAQLKTLSENFHYICTSQLVYIILYFISGNWLRCALMILNLSHRGILVVHNKHVYHAGHLQYHIAMMDVEVINGS